MKKQAWGAKTIAGFGILAAGFVACAGEDIPPIDGALRDALDRGFGGASMLVGNAGDGGDNGGGAGGSGTSGSASTGGGAAGGGEPVGNAGSGGGGNVCNAFETILLPRCGSAGCHNDTSTQGAFAVSEEAVADFIDAPSTRDTCDGLFIDSANPEESLIYTMLQDDFPAECGFLQMPLNGDLLTPDESACVLEWLGQFAE